MKREAKSAAVITFSSRFMPVIQDDNVIAMEMTEHSLSLMECLPHRAFICNERREFEAAVSTQQQLIHRTLEELRLDCRFECVLQFRPIVLNVHLLRPN